MQVELRKYLIYGIVELQPLFKLLDWMWPHDSVVKEATKGQVVHTPGTTRERPGATSFLKNFFIRPLSTELIEWPPTTSSTSEEYSLAPDSSSIKAKIYIPTTSTKERNPPADGYTRWVKAQA